MRVITQLGCGSVGSTMDVAREHYLAHGSYGVNVWAHHQTAGRGRQGRAWFTPPAGTQLSCTLIGWPIPLAEAWQLTPLTGVALCEGIVAALPTCAPRLRFPNDLWLKGRKLGGILVEAIPARDRPGWHVPLIGYGINVNLARTDFPEALRETATSLLCETGQLVSISSLFAAVEHALVSHWDAWRLGDPGASFLPRWHELLDREATRTYWLDGEPLLCRAEQLSATGELLLTLPGGVTRTISVAQVVLGED